MNRARFIAAAALAGASVIGVATFARAQDQPPEKFPPLTPILSGKKFTPPVRGQAEIDFTTQTKREKNMVVTTTVVKNTSSAPIARLTVDETWYDKGGALVTGGKDAVNGLLQPGEIKELVVRTPYDAKMSANKLQFTHANGTVKPTRVAKIDNPEGKEPAAKPAADKKPAPSKKKK